MTKLFSLLLLLSVLLFSCTQRIYFPDKATVTGFKNKGDAMINASLKMQQKAKSKNLLPDGSASSPSFDIAYAPLNHFGVTASYRSLNNRTIKENDTNALISPQFGGLFNGNRYEMGIVYFTKLSNVLYLEAQSGYSFGDLRREGALYPINDFKTKFRNIYLQSALGIYFDIARINFGFKYFSQNYPFFSSQNANLKYTIANLDRSYGADISSKAFSFISYFTQFELGHKFVFFNLQSGVVSPLGKNTLIPTSDIYLSLGLTFRYDKKLLKKKNNENIQ